MNWKGKIPFSLWGKVREAEEMNHKNLTEDAIEKIALVDSRLKEYGSGFDPKRHSYMFEWMTGPEVRMLMGVKGYLKLQEAEYHPLLNNYY